MRTPSIVSSWPVVVMSIVGAMRVGSPVEVVCPSPAPIWPAGPLLERGAVHVAGPAGHRRPGEDVLGDRRAP